MDQAKIKIFGKVQGVFFRPHAREKAVSLQLSGYAENMDDGTVALVVQGKKESIRKFIDWCNEGSPSAKVDNIEIIWQTASLIYSGFETY